ncbi:MAG: methionine synthase [Leptolyngbyaceae cyanobacterium CSU_1_3]|nr:methionine synthase [Leptolyngbyaceae cyanobacterium CSU_1_3]
MRSRGIYTLANDVVYDQLIALLNSIEANVSSDIPVCVIPFDDRLDRVQKAISTRPNVTLFDNQTSLDRWENFARQFAQFHPEAKRTAQSHPRWYQGKLHRKFAAFDGSFDEFIFYDGDSLAMKPVEDIFEKLQTNDFIFNDWEHKKPHENAALNIVEIERSSSFKESEIRPKLHCSSFFASKRGIFNPEETLLLQSRLQAEAGWVNGQGWWDDAFLFNYMTLVYDRPQFNFTLSLESHDRTGNCANSDPFVAIDQVLYNQQGLKPIHRIHYMGYASSDFARLSQGELVDIPHRDIFLHYRFLKELEQKPQVLKPASSLIRVSRFLNKTANKLKKYVQN